MPDQDSSQPETKNGSNADESFSRYNSLISSFGIPLHFLPKQKDPFFTLRLDTCQVKKVTFSRVKNGQDPLQEYISETNRQDIDIEIQKDPLYTLRTTTKSKNMKIISKSAFISNTTTSNQSKSIPTLSQQWQISREILWRSLETLGTSSSTSSTIHISKIIKTSSDLSQAWKNSERGRALRLVKNSIMYLCESWNDKEMVRSSSLTFIHIADLIIQFGDLVWGRIQTKLDQERNHSHDFLCNEPNHIYNDTHWKIHPEGSEFDVAAMMNDADSIECCHDWLYRIASIKRLIPRLFLQMVLLKCHIIVKHDIEIEIQRIRTFMNGIADPCTAIWARYFFILCAKNVVEHAKKVDPISFQLNPHEIISLLIVDVLGDYLNTFNDSILSSQTDETISFDLCMKLQTPAIQSILRTTNLNSNHSRTIGNHFHSLLTCFENGCNSIYILHTLISGFSPFITSPYVGHVIKLALNATLVGYRKPIICTRTTIITEEEIKQLKTKQLEFLKTLGRQISSNPCEDVSIPYSSLTSFLQHVSNNENIDLYLSCILTWMDAILRTSHHNAASKKSFLSFSIHIIIQTLQNMNLNSNSPELPTESPHCFLAKFPATKSSLNLFFKALMSPFEKNLETDLIEFFQSHHILLLLEIETFSNFVECFCRISPDAAVELCTYFLRSLAHQVSNQEDAVTSKVHNIENVHIPFCLEILLALQKFFQNRREPELVSLSQPSCTQLEKVYKLFIEFLDILMYHNHSYVLAEEEIFWTHLKNQLTLYKRIKSIFLEDKVTQKLVVLTTSLIIFANSREDNLMIEQNRMDDFVKECLYFCQENLVTLQNLYQIIDLCILPSCIALKCSYVKQSYELFSIGLMSLNRLEWTKMDDLESRRLQKSILSLLGYTMKFPESALSDPFLSIKRLFQVLADPKLDESYDKNTILSIKMMRGKIFIALISALSALFSRLNRNGSIRSVENTQNSLIVLTRLTFMFLPLYHRKDELNILVSDVIFCLIEDLSELWRNESSHIWQVNLAIDLINQIFLTCNLTGTPTVHLLKQLLEKCQCEQNAKAHWALRRDLILSIEQLR